MNIEEYELQYLNKQRRRTTYGIFKGNTESRACMEQKIDPPINTTYIYVRPHKWIKDAAESLYTLALELYGCAEGI